MQTSTLETNICQPRHPHDELANTLTHGFGLLLTIVGAAAMFTRFSTVEFATAVTCGVYVTSLVVVYAMSTASHAVQDPQWKYRLQIWDQGVIYLLIAGTYTPMIWAMTAGNIRLTVLLLVWAAAIAGFTSKVLMEHRIVAFSAISYVLLGWLPALPGLGSIPRGCLVWVVVGGVCYTVGVAFLTLEKRVRFFHAVWHILVIAGSATHFYAIYVYVLMRG